MSQSRAILTLHRRTGGDTQGGRALSRRTGRARGAPRLPCREQRVTARTSRPGPASKLPSFGRSGLWREPCERRGEGDGACLFLKSGSACKRPGSSEATQGGGPRRKEGRLLRPEAGRELGKWCVAPGTVEACRRRGQPGDPRGRPCRRWLQLCTRGGLRQPNFGGLRGGGSGCGGPPSPASSRPAARAPPRRVQRAQPRRVCAATQLARGPPTQARPRLESPPEPLSPCPLPAAGGGGEIAAAAPARDRETWGPAGTRWRAGPGRRDERLASCENLGAGAPDRCSVLGAVSARGDFAGTDLREGGRVAVVLWGQGTGAGAGEA